MIKVTDLSFGFPQKDLYNNICFEIENGEHAVLIGSNGTGKSTLVDMIIDTEKYLYDGKIEKDEDMRVGYVSQYTSHEGDAVVYDVLSQPFVDLQKESDEICAQMETAEDMEAVYARYQAVMDEIDAIDGYNYDVNIRKQLAVAGLSGLVDSTVDKISGGEYKLISIIKNMLLKPQLLIMDEPDAFLDFENLVGLSKLINAYEGTILVITHNRLLLSQCFNKILHLENMELQEFPGNFAEYNLSMLENKVLMQEQAKKEAEWIEVQQKVVERLRADATRIASPTKGKQLKARVTYLERLQARKTKDPFVEEHSLELHFSKPTDTEKMVGADGPVISVKNYSLAYDKTLLTDVNFEIFAGEKVAIVGANGTGKSSILRDIYNDMIKESGAEGADNAESMAYFDQIYESADTLSGGEKNVKQLKEIAEKNAKILFLDEPTSHLDTYAQIALEDAINEYKGTVLMVSHDFYTVTNTADRILLIEDGSLREMSSRAFRKMIYKKYFDSDLFESERLRKEREVRINALLKTGKVEEAKKLLC